ncbi:uncharacterized protein LOC132741862 [Ruditapes philippinarum]|uniref:uncharacterized protein LOC132741862 n=1 Tax=Ruditapes philippinarum TaxID=129788 RepID=UPI00295B2C49|nr:uncharacterized protein LOC132741862 [Ruditapes philippinarum]XP_060586108.1 uncharacterized protein LOC132741862 [Ruditapes philippinarum]
MYIKRKIDEGGRQTRLPCPVCKRKTKLRDASSFKKSLTISGFLDSIQKTSAEKKGKAETTETQICFEDIHIESNDEVNVINKKDIVNRKDETGKHLENEKYVVVATQEENITVENPIDNTNQKLLFRISLILFSAFLSIKNQKLLSRISLILFSAFLSIKNQKLLSRISLILFSAFLSIKNQELLPRISVILLRLFLTINFWPQIAFLYVLYVVDLALIIVSFFFLRYLAVLFITLDFTLNFQRRLSLINVLYENHVIVKKRGHFYLLVNLEWLNCAVFILEIAIIYAVISSFLVILFYGISEFAISKIAKKIILVYINNYLGTLLSVIVNAVCNLI